MRTLIAAQLLASALLFSGCASHIEPKEDLYPPAWRPLVSEDSGCTKLAGVYEARGEHVTLGVDKKDLWCTAEVLLFFPGFAWLTELIVPFRVQYLLLSAGAAAVAIFCRELRPASILCCSLVINLLHLSPYLSPMPAQASQGRPLRVLTANVHALNPAPGPFLTMLERLQPEIVVILELTPAWVVPLEQIRTAYPSQFLSPHDDAFGIGVLAKQDLALSELRLAPGLPAAIAGQGANGSFQLLGVHTFPPVGETATMARDRQLELIRDLAQTRDAPFIVLGDLNIPPWSPVFEKLFSGVLRDARLGFGIFPTWPSVLPLIPIDHVLVTDEVKVQQFWTERIPGSDHYAAAADLLLPTQLP